MKFAINNTFWKRPLFGVVLFFAVFVSCKKQEQPTFGVGVQPDNNQIGLLTTDTFDIECQTLRLDSVKTDQTDIGVIGSYHDPEFGIVRNSTVFQYRLASENIDIGLLQSSTIDSAVLTLVYANSYGTLENQTWRVYELTDQISTTADYFTNTSVTIDPQKMVGEMVDFKPDLSNIPVIDGEPERTEVRILLDSNFANRLVNVNQSVYNTIRNFLAEFPGFIVRPENSNQAVNTGAQLRIDLLNTFTRLTLYYTNNGTRNKLDYPINNSSARFVITENEYSGSNVGNAFGNTVVGSQRLFLQSLGGTQVKLRVKDIMRLKEKGTVILNKAEFLIPLEEGSIDRYAPIPQILGFAIDPDGKPTDTPDKGEVHFDGKLNTNDFIYRLGLTRYFQAVLDGRQSNNGILLREIGERSGRCIFSGPDIVDRPLKLVVTYTPT